MKIKIRGARGKRSTHQIQYRDYIVAYTGYYGEDADVIVFASSIYEAMEVAASEIGPNRGIIAAAPI